MLPKKNPNDLSSQNKTRLAKNKTGIMEASDDFDIIVKSTKSAKDPKEPIDLPNKFESSHSYFTEKDLSRILNNLDTLRDDVYPVTFDEETSEKKSPNFQVEKKKLAP